MKKIFLCVSLLALSGCATIFSGSTQTINVKVVESKTGDTLDGCACFVRDTTGSIHNMRSNPDAIKITRGSDQVVIECKKEGYRQLNLSVGDSFNAVTLVNILFWPGFIVDLATGSYRKYPSHFVVNMEKI